MSSKRTTDEGEHRQGLLAVTDQKSANDFETTSKEFEKWVAKQSLPIEAAITTIASAVSGAVMGVVVDVLFEGTCGALSIDSPATGGTIRPEILSFSRGYKPMLESFMVGGTFEQARNFAVMTGVNAGISRVMKKLRGKEDVQTCIVSGFGSGVMVSLVTGMRGPSVLSIGVLFALANAGLFKAEEKLSQEKLSKQKLSLEKLSHKQAEDVSHDKTKDVFSCIGFGLDHYAMNFNNGSLADNSIPFVNNRKKPKKGGRRTWW